MKRIVPLAELLACKNVYREDSNWAALLAEFKADPVQWRVVQQLAYELKTSRFFREPVYVGKDEEFDPDSLWVFDGTHRTCAYLLVGASEVEVLFEHDDDSEWREPEWLVETQIIGTDGYAMAIDEEEPGLPSLWSALMSLRIDDEIWLTSDMSSGDQEGLMVFWNDDAIKVGVEALDDAVRSQLAAFGFDMSRLSVRTTRTLNEWREEA